MRTTRPVLLTLFLLLSGCSGNMATVSGRIVDNGQPMKYAATQAAVQLTLMGANGKPDNSKSFTAVVNPDGTFQVVASGGSVPIGTYQVIMNIRDEDPKYKPFTALDSQIRREVKPGHNDLVLDLSKPAG